MATSVQFTGRTFYNREGQAIQLRISNEDFLGDTTFVRLVSCKLSYTKDEQIISSSLDVEIINDTSDFYLFNDLLLGTERQFKCDLRVDGTSEWEGYLINDLCEIDLLDNATIKLTFTDYLKRLKDTETPDLSLGDLSVLIDVIRDCLYLTDFDYDIRVNTNFYPEEAINIWNDPYWQHTMYEQVLLFDDVLFEDEVSTKNPYEVLQIILQFNNSFLYTYKKKWYIEQYSEIADLSTDSEGGHWHEFVKGEDSSAYGESTYEGATGHAPDSIDSQYNSMHRQDNDFKYIERSQKITYESGIKELEINIKRQLFETLVYNNFNNAPPTYPWTHTQINYEVGKWEVSNNITYSFLNGYQYSGIFRWFRYETVSLSDEWNGMAYHFRFTYNSAGDLNEQTSISVNFKWTSPNMKDLLIHLQSQVKLRYVLKRAGQGDILGWDSDGDPYWYGYPEADPYIYLKEYTRDSYLDVTEKMVAVGYAEVNDNIDITSSFEAGDDLDQEWTLIVWPTMKRIRITEDQEIEDQSESMFLSQIFGDFSVTINSKEEENKNIYSVTDDFIKKKSVDLTLFDTPNLNYRNGLTVVTEGWLARRQRATLAYPRTTLWGRGNLDSSGGIQEPKLSIVDHLASFLYAYYSETRMKLSAKVDIYEIVKPLTIITDNNIYKESVDDAPDFILFEYEYDYVTNTMRITANEYGDETINIIES